VGKKEQIIVAIRLNKCDNEELYDELEHTADRGWGTRSCYLRHLIQRGYEASKEKEQEGDQLLEGYDNKLDSADGSGYRTKRQDGQHPVAARRLAGKGRASGRFRANW